MFFTFSKHVRSRYLSLSNPPGIRSGGCSPSVPTEQTLNAWFRNESLNKILRSMTFLQLSTQFSWKESEKIITLRLFLRKNCQDMPNPTKQKKWFDLIWFSQKSDDSLAKVEIQVRLHSTSALNGIGLTAWRIGIIPWTGWKTVGLREISKHQWSTWSLTTCLWNCFLWKLWLLCWPLTLWELEMCSQHENPRLSYTREAPVGWKN